MLEVGWSEILVIALILIIVVGPKDLPPMLRTFGRMATRLRGMANEFKGQFDQALREAELDDVRKGLSEVNKLNPTNTLRDAMNPIRKLGEDIKSDLKKASDMNTPAAVTPVTAAEAVAEAAEESPIEMLADALTSEPTVEAKPEPVADTKPAQAVTSNVPPVVQAGIAPVVPPAADKVAESKPVAAQPFVPNVIETPATKPKATRKKPETVSEAAVASSAEPKTKKAPVRTNDAAIAAVAAETVAKKPSSRKKAAVTEFTSDLASAEAAKPKRTRKKTEEAGDA